MTDELARSELEDPGRSERASVGAVQAGGLLIAGSLAMLGIVLTVNPARYGATGAFLGVAVLAFGTVGTIFLFRGIRFEDPES